MTIIAHSRRLIALHDGDAQDATAIDLRIPECAATGMRRQREGTPRAEIAARLAQARHCLSERHRDPTAP